MKDKKRFVSVKEAIRLNVRAFKAVYKDRKKVLVLRMIKFAFAALSPYIGVWLSARLLDEIAGARDPERLMMWVLWALISAAVITLVQSVLDRWHDAEQAGMWIHVDHLMSEKMRTMDFADVDNPKTHEMLSVIRQNRQGGGWGLHRMTHNVSNLWMALFQAGGGVALTVTLFTTPVPETAGSYTWLNSPFVTVGIIALMLLLTLSAPKLSSVGGRAFARNSGAQNLGNRLFNFYARYGRWEQTAVDARIYDLSAFCETYNLDKTQPFLTKGFFAALARKTIGPLNALSTALTVLFTGVVYLYVCVKGLGGAFGVGSITQYVGAVTMLAGSFSTILSQLGDMRNNAVFLKLVFEYLDIPNAMYQGSLTVEKRRDRDYEIEFRNVSFKYPGSEAYALKNVSFRFKIGQRLAVVGRNGSGKTTFIKLLCRLYDPTEGEILLNGINIRKYEYQNYLSVFSVVFQDFHILALPIGENVAGCVSYDRERATMCLWDAGFGGRLQTLPDGIDTVLYKSYEPKGIDVSGGEAQKIALARALYKDAPFIVLDEPTAALDPVAEAEVYANFNTIVGDKTAVYISHRLSSCRFCDQIAVFEDGAIVQHGTHEELAADREGLYHELWNAQAQYYKEA